jgi:O-acetyl-ADP-ribose deacetylase (regulator of RNase III)
MSVQVIEDNLLESGCNIIGHQANCFTTMGAGVAAAIKKKYPRAFEADCEDTRSPSDKFGSYTAAVQDGVTIYNLYGQFNYGSHAQQTNYYKLFDALRLMKLDIIENNTGNRSRPKIGFPKLGCGLAGGDWNIVYGIISTVFHDREVFVYCLR